MGRNKQFCRQTWNHYKCQPGYCLFIGREAISIKVFLFGHGATTNWLSNKDRAIWFLVTYMEPPAPGQHRSIYLSKERWAMMTGVKYIYWTELLEFCTFFFCQNIKTIAIIQWDRLLIVGRWAMTSDVRNGILHSQLTPERPQITPDYPQKFLKSSIWDIFTEPCQTSFLHCPLSKSGLNSLQSEYWDSNLSTLLQMRNLTFQVCFEVESQTPLIGYYFLQNGEIEYEGI